MKLLRIDCTPNLLSEHDSLPLSDMAKNMVMEEVKNKKIKQFQLGYMSYPGLNQNQEFKDQVEISTALKFDKNISP